ncbi:MAG: ferritin-like domain-containing protein [Solirubrobacteraceae bacterium]|nr:ferritin-like domain-containing protein [Solirubrobacteraceae bacterium]
MIADAVDRLHAGETAATRRRFVGGAAAAIGGLGLLSLPTRAMAANDAQTILNVAATAEVLATIVNTLAVEKVDFDRTTKKNIQAAAREELLHYQFLTANGAKPATTKIWVPDALFKSDESVLKGLVAGDQVFVNAYLIGVTAFAQAGQADLARYSAEIMGVEAVHRALALQSLGKLGNDRAYSLYDFTNIEDAVAAIGKLGFGLGKPGKGKGKLYDFAEVSKRTPNPDGVNTKKPA